MKRFPFVATSLLVLAAALHGADGSNYTPESRTSGETFSTKVLKVYAFQDGDGEYVAYVVNWKDHEVVVTPFTSGSQMKYQVGDTIRCQMSQASRRIDDTAKARLSFSLLSSLSSSLVADSSAETAQRRQEVLDELKTRRERRQAETHAAAPPPPATVPSSAPKTP